MPIRLSYNFVPIKVESKQGQAKKTNLFNCLMTCYIKDFSIELKSKQLITEI